MHEHKRQVRAEGETDKTGSIGLGGLVVPPCTPFNADGKIDERAFARHLEYLAERGVTRLLVNGTTAEFFSLLPAERQDLLRLSKRHFPGMILFNTGSDSLALALDAACRAEDYGADAIVAMAPYYYAGVGEEGLVRFFNELRDSVDVPMVIYNFTLHTGNAVTPEILRRVPHVAVKDSSGDASLIPATPCYLAGTSKNMVEQTVAGARGFVSALACCMPGLYVGLEDALTAGELDEAQCLQDEIRGRAATFSQPNEIACIKRDLANQLTGYPLSVRLPLLGT